MITKPEQDPVACAPRDAKRIVSPQGIENHTRLFARDFHHGYAIGARDHADQASLPDVLAQLDQTWKVFRVSLERQEWGRVYPQKVNAPTVELS